MKRFILPLLGAAAILAAGVTSQAQIERLDLNQMVQKTDDALFAEIISKEVIRIDHPTDGAELYFTHMTLEGTSLVTGETESVIVTFNGGFINDTDGVWNSEAPSADDTKIGNKIVAFYKHIDNAGGDLECNYLYAGHGGLYRTVNSPKGTVIMGRGEGYAIQSNTRMDEMITAIENVKEAR
ncbi:MAG: hypothetical protein P8N31_01105 [Planctomycetota bacterium]|jgi:hypothetical protein|nr:hypothetical protein [Planctomycetota bacterium]MDG2142130.1 hypothetical protein [Planctomycetota bacterium]